MFGQFLSPGENIVRADFLGTKGIFPFSSYSFSCLTNERVASLEIGPFRKVEYDDVWHKSVNGAEIKQPSKFYLYLGLIIMALIFFVLWESEDIRYLVWDILDALSDLIGWIAFPLDDFFTRFFELVIYYFLFNLFIRGYYIFVKCGLVFKIKERDAVYIFCDRERMLKINQFYREWSVFKRQPHNP
ncbi:MAG: hypothetical protein IPJ40_20680 [Saprospirales bacterium]|nr:hypothetical protein [Saprospirales bacterium]